MDIAAVCKYNKYGHCKYGKHCNFIHVNSKCEMNDCDVKKCTLRHPKDCKFVMRNKKCRFGEEYCSFEHNTTAISATAMEDNGEDTIKMLRGIIEAKDKEIENLKNSVRKFNISQVDGEASYEDLNLDEVDTSSSGESDLSRGTDEDSYVSDDELFQCEVCEFQTQHKNGLKIHLSKVHKNKCDQCGKTFTNKKSLNRHIQAKVTFSNIDPTNSPKKDMNIEILKSDESCLVVFDSLERNKLIVLHSFECWSRKEHSCAYLPPEALEKDSVLKDPDLNALTLHTEISYVVMGDLTMAGCYVDWNCVQKMIAGQKA